MAKKRDRIFAGFFAGLFLVTSSAFAIGIIISMVQQHNQKPSDTSAAKSQGKTMDNSNKLQGTKLANFTPVASIGQLETVDSTPGTGEAAKSSDTITVDYTGAVAATGVIFQSSKDSGQPVSFPLSQVIPGWTKGIPGMKVGGTRRLLIPSVLAYGATPPQGSGIPANADLVFDVTLHKIGK
jgi:FKBP-type peptidyl-prolyl cis-trans isomerase FkpA